ncbi:hypothetical protein GQ600_20261 [Phytophthora cactorum]|nr:hypothetical protein GQ600_20261 [Phytophthora cactorum]
MLLALEQSNSGQHAIFVYFVLSRNDRAVMTTRWEMQRLGLEGGPAKEHVALAGKHKTRHCAINIS